MATKAKTATRTTANPSSQKPQGGGTSGANFLAQYESALMGGVGRGTEGNPLGDFAQGAEAFWNASGNLRAYGDRLRGDARKHERGMQGDQLRSQEAQTGMQTAAQKAVAGTQASSDRFQALKNLEGIKTQTAGRVQEAGIGAKAQVDVAGLQTAAQRYLGDVEAKTQRHQTDTQKYLGELEAGTQKYRTNADLMGNLAGLASSERIAKGQQAGETDRTRMQLAGSIMMNKEDNYTARSNKFFDYMGNVAQSQWRAPDANNIRYWG